LVVVTGIELVVGNLAAWGVRKLRRVGERADAEADRVLDAALDRLHEVVSGRLAGDPALAKLEESAGQVTERTSRRVSDALAEAAEEDPGFRAAVVAAVEAVRSAEQRSGADLAGQVTIVASRERSVAAQTVSGVVVTGDQGYVQR
jgi:hypothetical protein